MTAHIINDGREADVQQVASLCDELDERISVMQEEQHLLQQLVTTTQRARPHQANRYRALLAAIQTRYQYLREIIVRYCR